MNPDTLHVFHNGDLLLTVGGGEKLALNELGHEVLKIIRTAPHGVKLGPGKGTQPNTQRSKPSHRKLRNKELHKTTLNRQRTTKPPNSTPLHKPQTKTINKRIGGRFPQPTANANVIA